MSTRTIRVDYLTRVEGEGSLLIRFKGKEAQEVKLSIFEPPRFFEALLRGRSAMEAPDITAPVNTGKAILMLPSAPKAVVQSTDGKVALSGSASAPTAPTQVPWILK